LSGSAWVVHAEKLNKHWLWYDWESSQVPSFNALFVMMLIPTMSFLVFPLINKFFPLNAMRKIAIGMFLIISPFLVMVWLEYRVRAGEVPSIGWQFLGNFLLTVAEIFVSISCLEFAYTQAPKEMKSFIMSLYLAASIGLGNFITFLLNQFTKYFNLTEGPSYYWVFIIYMFVAAVIFAVFSAFYKGKTYTQDDAPAAA
jgi:POT family proton-dependent oligopeptide transporter